MLVSEVYPFRKLDLFNSVVSVGIDGEPQTYQHHPCNL